MPFTCSICGEESMRICARCTKDACDNHLCEKCLRCSDCCECEVALAEPTTYRVVHPETPRPAAAPEPVPEPAPAEPAPFEPALPEITAPVEVPRLEADTGVAESEEPNTDGPRPTQYNG